MLYNVYMVNCNSLGYCGICCESKQFLELTEVVITSKTGEMCYGRRDVHPHGAVTGRVETKRYGFQKSVRVQKKVCAGCLWTANQAARRSNGKITIRELR